MYYPLFQDQWDMSGQQSHQALNNRMRLKMKLYGKTRWLQFFHWTIHLCTYASTNISASRVPGISKETFHHDFLDRGLLLTRTLLNQGSWLSNWCHSFECFVATIMTSSDVTKYMYHKGILIIKCFFHHWWLIADCKNNESGVTSASGTP